MQAYYTEEERNHFWAGGENDEGTEQGDPDGEKKDDGEIKMASRADVNTLYQNSRKTEDYFKGKILRGTR